MSLGRLGLIQAGQPSKQCPTLAEMTADATATAADIMAGKTAYARGEKLTGTLVPVTKIDVAAEGIKFAYSTFEEVPEVFDFSNVTDAKDLLSYNTNLKSIPEDIDFLKITNAQGIFASCGSLKIDIDLNFLSCLNFSYAFQNSGILSVISISSPVANMVQSIFLGSAIKSVLSIDFPVVNTANNFFQNCKSLVTVQGLNMPALTSANGFLAGCNSLQSIDRFDFSNMTSAINMFQDCSALSSIGDVIFLHTALSLADSPNIDEETLNRFGGFANAAGESGVAPLKSLGLPAAALTFNTAAQTYLETEGIIAKLTDENWTVNFADSM